VDPLHKGVIVEFNDRKILVAFDEEIEADKLPKNICLVQLCNQVTYDKIQENLERLESGDSHEDSSSLVRVLFEVGTPTNKNDIIFGQMEIDKELSYERGLKMRGENFPINDESHIEFINLRLNDSQKEAVRFCLDANQLALIHGPPGTGKTTTVVELILQSIIKGLKILVVAPSNIAVDNIAEKLIPHRQKLNFDLCRIGHPARIMPVIHEICLDSKVERSSNMKFVKDVKRNIEKVRKELNKTEKRNKEKRNELKLELKQLRDDIKGSYRNTVIDIYSKNQVILATCVGAADYYLKESLKKHGSGTFDIVVIDECAQATESVCWKNNFSWRSSSVTSNHKV
jgi:superfamily I DNA and/or RNA helicase